MKLMDKPFKFLLPSPNFDKNAKDACKSKPHYLTPSGMSLLPREKQPPPMYGKHGATLPARYLREHHLKGQQIVSSATPKPSEKQYCESCELELHSLEDLKLHRAQHEKCPVSGCHYKGHPSVMDNHVSALHASGLFDKFKKLSTPEEIAAWREERRKRYPTLANVILKQRAKEQRQKRGERLESNKNRFGNANDRKRAQNMLQDNKSQSLDNKSSKKNKRNRKNKHKILKNTELRQKEQNEKPKIEKMELDDELTSVGIKMFRGTSQLENYEHVNENKKADTNNALYALVGMYGSDDDDQESENDDNGKNDNAIKEKKMSEINSEESSEPFTSIGLIGTNGENGKISDNILNNEITEVLNSGSSDFTNSPTNTFTIEKTEMLVIKKPKSDTFPTENTVNSSIESDGSSEEGPEEKPIQRINPDYPLTSANDSKIKPSVESEAKCSKPIDRAKSKIKLKRKYGLDYRKARLRKQNTMLEKMLDSDIRHERNVLLQCVRFVCENNFFNIGKAKGKESIVENII